MERYGGPTARGIEADGGDRGHYGNADTRWIVFFHDAIERCEGGSFSAAIFDEHFHGAGAKGVRGDSEQGIDGRRDAGDDYRLEFSAGYDGALRKHSSGRSTSE